MEHVVDSFADGMSDGAELSLPLFEDMSKIWKVLRREFSFALFIYMLESCRSYLEYWESTIIYSFLTIYYFSVLGNGQVQQNCTKRSNIPKNELENWYLLHLHIYVLNKDGYYCV